MIYVDIVLDIDMNIDVDFKIDIKYITDWYMYDKLKIRDKNNKNL